MRIVTGIVTVFQKLVFFGQLFSVSLKPDYFQARWGDNRGQEYQLVGMKPP